MAGLQVSKTGSLGPVFKRKPSSAPAASSDTFKYSLYLRMKAAHQVLLLAISHEYFKRFSIHR
jgi:hypothetical protein